MARNTGCLCRVPVAEIGPSGVTTTEVYAWAERYGAELGLDYLGRLSVSVADAYSIREQIDAEMAAHEAQRAREAERVRTEAAKAQQRRQKTYEGVRRQLRGKHPREASREAWNAVHEAEAALPAEIKAQLGPVQWNEDASHAEHVAAVNANWMGGFDDE